MVFNVKENSGYVDDYMNEYILDCIKELRSHPDDDVCKYTAELLFILLQDRNGWRSLAIDVKEELRLRTELIQEMLKRNQ